MNGRTSVLTCFLSSWFMQLKGKKWKLWVWILYSEVFTQSRLLVCQSMLALFKLLPKLCNPNPEIAFGQNCLPQSHYSHEQILLRRWSRLHPNSALRQMLPHLWGSNSFNVLLPAVSGRWGWGGWRMINIWHFAVSQPKFWLLKFPFIHYHYKSVCVYVHVLILPEQWLVFTVKVRKHRLYWIKCRIIFAHINTALLTIQMDCLI